MVTDRFVNFLKYEKRYSAHTLVAYQHELARYLAYLETQKTNVDEVTHRQARTYLSGLLEQGQLPASINRSLSALRTYYKFLMREQAVLHNPFTLIKALKTPKKLPVTVDEDKLTNLLDRSDVFPDTFEGLRDKVVLELLFGTGIRRAELLQIQDTHIDFYNSNILIFGKRNKERLVPLNHTLGRLLQQYVEEKKKQGLGNKSSHLIVTKEGKRPYPKLIYDIVTHYLSNISLQAKKSPHVLRHTFATALLNNGADLNAIKELLGHAGLAATQVYTHNSVERLKSIYKQAHPKA